MSVKPYHLKSARTIYYESREEIRKLNGLLNEVSEVIEKYNDVPHRQRPIIVAYNSFKKIEEILEPRKEEQKRLLEELLKKAGVNKDE